jgi:hypothetical protein
VDNDIVTQLREKYAGQLPICLEAADEIERLRKYIGLLSLTVELQTNELKELKNG